MYLIKGALLFSPWQTQLSGKEKIVVNITWDDEKRKKERKRERMKERMKERKRERKKVKNHWEKEGRKEERSKWVSESR